MSKETRRQASFEPPTSRSSIIIVSSFLELSMLAYTDSEELQLKNFYLDKNFKRKYIAEIISFLAGNILCS